MFVGDPVGDLITRIRNAQMRSRPTTRSPSSRLRVAVLKTLQEEGFIRGYSLIDGESGFPEIEIEIKYHEGRPVIREISRISRPGRRVYAKADAIPQVCGGLGISILSTSRGVMSDADAVRRNIGGELLCRVF